jgi:hypothetical protein
MFDMFIDIRKIPVEFKEDVEVKVMLEKDMFDISGDSTNNTGREEKEMP